MRGAYILNNNQSMTNKEIEFVLRMRDEATQTWRDYRTQIEAGSKNVQAAFAITGVAVKNLSTDHAVLTEAMKQMNDEQARQVTSFRKVNEAMATAMPYLQQVQRGFSLIAQAAEQASVREINAINKARAAALKSSKEKQEQELERIDTLLDSETLSEEQKNKLRAERNGLVKKFQIEEDAVREQFDKKEREARYKAFKADKAAKIVQSIIDTASAVVEALPNIPLSIAVGALGAAQTVLIASQPEPQFHHGSGGPVFFNAPPSQNIPILVRGGETFEVTTESEQRRDSLPERLYGSTFIININGPISTPEAFKKIVQDGMRQMGITDVNQYFKNNRAKVMLA
ncbi:MAG: hypothetical protein EPO24_13205 [Bacteroidetes bacterium]|nr:MAG: hypothetical protein EPO24_13205 [Bacteroidota bacterium]